eukprot:TRINITY_DN14748_c0_g1_i6.p1 TRINITY_DN14748_c0_g1~~TRINITY_DN14748_c0_g1_i6.p1  ORF type:complete len:367 (-),score=24.79 TRINITY_DN14748_c0_g1_i6:65-1165(-)
MREGLVAVMRDPAFEAWVSTLDTTSAKGTARGWRDVIVGGRFWREAQETVFFFKHVFILLRKFDQEAAYLEDVVPMLAQTQAALENTTLPIRKRQMCLKLWKRRAEYATTWAAHAAYCLHPRHRDADFTPHADGLEHWLYVMYPKVRSRAGASRTEKREAKKKDDANANSREDTLAEFLAWRHASLTGFAAALLKRDDVRPAHWWASFGGAWPLVCKAAVLVGQRATSTATERSWSLYGLVHTGVRNRLGTAKASQLAELYFNSRGSMLAGAEDLLEQMVIAPKSAEDIPGLKEGSTTSDFWYLPTLIEGFPTEEMSEHSSDDEEEDNVDASYVYPALGDDDDTGDEAAQEDNSDDQAENDDTEEE